MNQINTIRALSIDAIQKANSGHPGAPLGFAPVAWTLFDSIMKHNPQNPNWWNRDRFILSAGHASMLLYSTLHLCGYDLSLDDIKSFRQWGSRCAGHPEYGVAPGIEISTGPLGQGAASSVGFAIAQYWLADRYNRENYPIIDYFTYVILGDGCMMEGITYEAASIAGHLKLGKLVWIYDSNDISIEGKTSVTFSDEMKKRFEACGWQVLEVFDANNVQAVEKALLEAKKHLQQPSLVVVKSHIGYGSPAKQDSADSHGAPLGVEEVVATKQALGLDPEKFFDVDNSCYEYANQLAARGMVQEREWKNLFRAYQNSYPKEATELMALFHREFPAGWNQALPQYEHNSKGIATRTASGDLLNFFAKRIPWLVGGSADLGPSNKTILKEKAWISSENRGGANIHFGVREHAMGAICNGLALSGLTTFCSTFFVFSDYMRSSIRLAALMKLPVHYIFTHDSIFVGEDGPTHQPIEHLASLRAMPGLDVVRPSDANELGFLWEESLLQASHPTAFILTRQNIPLLDRTECAPAKMAAKGGYLLYQTKKEAFPQLILIATGSETALALEAAKQLGVDNQSVWVVAMPSTEIFDRQTEEYRDSVLPPSCTTRLVVETASSFGWHKYVLNDDPACFITRDDFGVSAPDLILAKEFGFTVENILEKAKFLLSGAR